MRAVCNGKTGRLRGAAALHGQPQRKPEPGLFFCISGARFDAHDYAAQAVQNGAAALVVERFLPLDVPQLLVTDTRLAFGPMCAELYGHPARQMKMVGITGTKGKTTTSYLIKAILEQAGYKCGLIGTTGNMIGDRSLKKRATTPDPIELQKTFRNMADEGGEMVSMEVSAHATDMHRVDGASCEVGCYTNLTQDHLDYFHTMDKYFETKRKFFHSAIVRNATLNADDETTAQILEDMQIPAMTYGISSDAEIYARDIEITENGVSFPHVQRDERGERQIKLQMTGIFNVYNALTAASAALLLGVSMDDIVKGLESVRAVPGRAGKCWIPIRPTK